MTQSGIKGYVHTKTSITLLFANNSMYRYDLSKALNKQQLTEMVKLAKKGSGLNGYLNSNPDVRRYGFLDGTLSKGSFKAYG